MPNNPFMKEYAQRYDEFYKDKNYGYEAELVKRLLTQFGVNTVLDVACGTGNHAKFLAQDFDMTLQDASPYMLDIAKKKLSGLVSFNGVKKMEDFRGKKRYDAIICLFSAIDYVQDIDKALRNFYRVLDKGGVVIFDFWNAEVVEKRYEFYKNKNGRESYTTLNPAIKEAEIDIHFGDFREIHTMKYYSITEMMEKMNKVGFAPMIAPFSSDLWNILMVGVK